MWRRRKRNKAKHLPENRQQVTDGKGNGQESADPEHKVQRVPLDTGHHGGESTLLRLLVCSFVCHCELMVMLITVVA